MSTHRKIEWSLFVLGLAGVVLAIWSKGSFIEMALYAAVTLFAGLHVFHKYDGRKANNVVVAGSLVLAIYTIYLLSFDLSSGYGVYASLSIGITLSILSLRLRRDFHQS